MIVPKGGLPSEQSAAIGAGEAADGNREAIDQSNRWGMRRLRKQRLPDVLLDPPQIGRLADERRAVNSSQRRKEVDMVSPEVGAECRVLIQAQLLADDFHGQDFTVRQGWQRSPLAYATAREQHGHRVIDQAGGRYNQRLQVHGAPPWVSGWSPPMVGPRGLAPKPAHGVK